MPPSLYPCQAVKHEFLLTLCTTQYIYVTIAFSWHYTSMHRKISNFISTLHDVEQIDRDTFQNQRPPRNKTSTSYLVNYSAKNKQLKMRQNQNAPDWLFPLHNTKIIEASITKGYPILHQAALNRSKKLTIISHLYRQL